VFMSHGGITDAKSLSAFIEEHKRLLAAEQSS
jgi:hypothetical protein